MVPASSQMNEYSGTYVADIVRKVPRRGPLRKKVKSSGARAADIIKEDVQEDPSPMKVDIDQAIDLMRFAFKEGMAFLDNGSGRSLDERMLVDMSGYMFNMLFEGPGVSRRDAPRQMRVITPTLDKDIAHAFAKEARKCIAYEFQGDLFGMVADVCSIASTCKRYLVLFARDVNGKKGRITRLPSFHSV